MIMQTVDLWDELTFCDVTTDEIVITSDSSELPDVKDNIIYKACRMMKDIYGIDKGVHVTVDKHIPVAAGMAGEALMQRQPQGDEYAVWTEPFR